MGGREGGREREGGGGAEGEREPAYLGLVLGEEALYLGLQALDRQLLDLLALLLPSSRTRSPHARTPSGQRPVLDLIAFLLPSSDWAWHRLRAVETAKVPF